MKLFAKAPLALAVVMAASAHAEDSVELDDVKVYGEKQEKNLQDIPTSVGVITEDQIVDSNIQNMTDVYSRLANVSSLRGGNEGLFAIRGISVQGLSDNPNTFTAGVYVDEIPLDNLSIRYGSMGVWDVQQIEVYRGPQSTLQGRNALNGAIHIKTQDPTYDWRGKAQAMYGSFDTSRLSVAGGGGLIDDELAVRLSIDDYRSDGFVDNVTRNEDDYAGFQRATYRGKVLFEPKSLDKLTALLTVSSVHNNNGDNPNVQLDDPFEYEARSDHQAYNDVLTDTAALNVSWDFNDQLKLTSVTAYAKDHYDRLDDFDSTSDPQGFIDQAGRSEALSQEIRLNFNFDRISGVAGIYYGNIDRDTDWQLESAYPKLGFRNTILNALESQGLPEAVAEAAYGLIPDLVFAAQDLDSNYETENYAVFGEATWKATEQLALTLGARYDNEEQKRVSVTDVSILTQTGNEPLDQLLQGFAAFLQSPGEDVKTDYDAFLPKFAAQYYWHDDLNTGFSVQKGYRAGGSVVNQLGAEVVDFDPEYTWNYEVFMRSQWLENRLTLNANVFYTEWVDQQVDVSPSGDSRDKYTDNAGESELYGAELETSVLITPTWEIFANVGYVETEYKKFTLKVGDELIDYKGNQFIGAPNWTASLGSNYRHYSGWFIGADTNYQDEVYLDNDNTRETNARILLNAKVGYEALDWSVYLWGTNLTDKEYVTQTYNQLYVPTETGENLIGTQDYATVGAPRMIGMTVLVNF